MFGLLKGSCRFSPSERQEWMGHVCGLCLALKRDHGQVARLTTNYDAALLSVLYEAQSVEPLPRASHYCLLRPGKRADVVAEHAGSRYAASICTLMAATKLADHVADGDSALQLLPTFANGVASSWTRKAQRTAAAVDFSTERIEAQTRRQAEVERQTGVEFYTFSRPTELAAAAAFGHTAVLANCPGNIAPLEQIGQMYGRILYLIDSLRDYVADKAAGRFNALAEAASLDEARRRAKEIFVQAHAALAEAFTRLTLPRPGLARTLLLKRLQQIGLKAVSSPSDDPQQEGITHSSSGKMVRRRVVRQQRGCFCNACDCDCCAPDACDCCCCTCEGIECCSGACDCCSSCG